MPLSLVVLAAGIGSRYGGLKQIDPVGPSGEIVIDYSVYDALRAGFDRVVCVIRRDIEPDFRAAIGARFERHADVQYVFQDLSDLPAGFSVPAQRVKPWGTAHAIRAARRAVREPFAVINADDFYGRGSYDVLAPFLRSVSAHEPSYAMVGFVLGQTLSEHGHVARGICQVDARGFLQSVTERTRIEKAGEGARFAGPDGTWQILTGRERVSMNMWGFTPALFDVLDERFERFLREEGQNPKAEFFIPTVLDQLVREGHATVRMLESQSPWFGVTYPQDKAVVVERVRALVKAGQYPARLWT